MVRHSLSLPPAPALRRLTQMRVQLTAQRPEARIPELHFGARPTCAMPTLLTESGDAECRQAPAAMAIRADPRAADFNAAPADDARVRIRLRAASAWRIHRPRCAVRRRRSPTALGRFGERRTSRAFGRRSRTGACHPARLRCVAPPSLSLCCGAASGRRSTGPVQKANGRASKRRPVVLVSSYGRRSNVPVGVGRRAKREGERAADVRGCRQWLLRERSPRSTVAAA